MKREQRIKGYAMGSYVYAYGIYKPEYAPSISAKEEKEFMAADIAYWKAFYLKKYKGHF